MNRLFHLREDAFHAGIIAPAPCAAAGPRRVAPRFLPGLATRGCRGRSYNGCTLNQVHKEFIMTARINFYAASSAAIQALSALEAAVNQLGLEPSLLELVKLRASQINGCAYCVDLHTTEARKAGETERRLHGVAVWRETPFFSERERAALAWTESLTQLSLTHAPDADYALIAAHFSDKEMVDLTLAISTINSWNRFAVGFRKQPAA